MTHAIRITQSNGSRSVHPLGATQITIGSSPEAGICLPGEGLLSQHVLLAPRGETCWVSTAAGSPLWDHSGAPIEGAYVPWGSRLTFGKCVFELQRRKRDGNPRPASNLGKEGADKADESSEPSRDGIHPGILMLLLASVIYAALQGFTGTPDSVVSSGLTEAPALFAEASTTCKGANPAHRAVIAEEQALAKSERAVFDLRDGVEAVELFAEAGDCYRKAGREAESEQVVVVGEAFRHGMQEQYDLLRLRLSRDLAEDNLESAKTQASRLTELLNHRADTDYAIALRRLSARLSKQGQTL